MRIQPRRTLTVALPALLALVVTGCASSADTPPAGGTGSAAPNAVETPPTGSPACDLLDADQVTALAGQPLDGPYESAVGGDEGFPACVWGDPEGATVQVTRVPGEDWAVRLPTMFEQLESAGMLDDAENARKVREASELVGTGQAVDAGQACDVFSAMLEIAGVEPGQTWTVNIVPTLEAPEALTGQSCADGVFSSVLVVRDGITGAADEIAAVQQALATVIDAGR
ncbi:DUF3558 family protein [Oerskovia turbata]